MNKLVRSLASLKLAGVLLVLLLVGLAVADTVAGAGVAATRGDSTSVARSRKVAAARLED